MGIVADLALLLDVRRCDRVAGEEDKITASTPHNGATWQRCCFEVAQSLLAVGFLSSAER